MARKRHGRAVPPAECTEISSRVAHALGRAPNWPTNVRTQFGVKPKSSDWGAKRQRCGATQGEREAVLARSPQVERAANLRG
jgi:hypothetical protein